MITQEWRRFRGLGVKHIGKRSRTELIVVETANFTEVRTFGCRWDGVPFDPSSRMR
jgi:hypothetical protein